MRAPLFATVVLWALLIGWASRAAAQSPINAPGAMQPSNGTGVYHIMPMYRETGTDPTSDLVAAQEFLLVSQIAYGLRNDLSLQFDVPLVYSDQDRSGPNGDDIDRGVGDMTLLLKYRVFQEDPAPTDTIRFSVIGGLQIPGTVPMEMDSSNDAWDPIIGAVFSTVRGRHGFNASALWEFYTGDDAHDDDDDGDQSDSLRYDASYLYRLSPAEYSAESQGAIYAVAELNGFYGVNGDHELFLSPGLMYEARTFTLDATVMIPIHQEVDHRAESEFLFGVGARISF